MPPLRPLPKIAFEASRTAIVVTVRAADLAMASPTEKRVIDEIEFVTGKRVFPYVALAGPLMRAISSALLKR